jgi:hypothetical protein
MALPFDPTTIIPAWKSPVEKFLAYNFFTFGQLPDLNDLALEGLVFQSLKSNRPDADWVKGAHLPWDLSLLDDNLRIQVKGTLVHGKGMHLSSFRLGSHVGDESTSIQTLKDGILKMLYANDVWYIVARETEDTHSMKVSFFECDRSSFLYDETLYDFTKTVKRTSASFECVKDGIKSSVRPSASHQLWYSLNFNSFKKMKGVKTVDVSTFKVEDFPKVIFLN